MRDWLSLWDTKVFLPLIIVYGICYPIDYYYHVPRMFKQARECERTIGCGTDWIIIKEKKIEKKGFKFL